MTIHEKTLEYLYREQRKAKQAYGQAEYRPGVTMEELENLRWKIKAIDYCIPLVLAALHETPLPVAIIKRALVDVKQYCKARQSLKYQCDGCVFCGTYCRIFDSPESWLIDDWEEDGKDADL